MTFKSNHFLVGLIYQLPGSDLLCSIAICIIFFNKCQQFREEEVQSLAKQNNNKYKKQNNSNINNNNNTNNKKGTNAHSSRQDNKHGIISAKVSFYAGLTGYTYKN